MYLLAKLSQYGEDDIKRFRMQVYANIVLASIHCIEQNKASLGFSDKDSAGSLVFLKRLFRIRPDRDFEGTVKEIKNLNERLLQRLTYNPQNVSLREADTVRGGIQTTLAVPLAGSATVDATTESETEKKVDFVGTNLSHENAAEFILEYFKQLQKILSLSFSLILLDECSETTQKGQVEIFRLLKQVRGAADSDIKKNYIYFLAAAYPPLATYYPSKLHGDSFNFDLGHKHLSGEIVLCEHEPNIGQFSADKHQNTVYLDSHVPIRDIPALASHETCEKYFDQGLHIPWNPVGHRLATICEYNYAMQREPESEWDSYNDTVGRIAREQNKAGSKLGISLLAAHSALNIYSRAKNSADYDS